MNIIQNLFTAGVGLSQALHMIDKLARHSLMSRSLSEQNQEYKSLLAARAAAVQH
jgi:hypothetical protein